MVKGIGTDLVSISRIEKSLLKHGDRFAQKILGQEEYEAFCESKRQANFLAKRFAAKEATAKALGTGFSEGVSWKDIQTQHDAKGKPSISLSNAALLRFQSLSATNIFLSLSDEEPFVIAYVVIA